MRISPDGPVAFNSKPFAGNGASLYAGAPGGTKAQYRKLRILDGVILKGQGGEFQAGASSVLKTARVAHVSSPTNTLTFAVPTAWHSQTVPIDVRHHQDNVECEVSQPRLITFDSSGVPINVILGTAYLLDQQQRDGGVMRLIIVWQPSTSGVQPNSFTLHRTAGPTSPADIVVSYNGTDRTVEFDTGALNDASAYTFSISCADSVSGATATLLTGISVQADATGPGAPTGGGAQSW